MTEYKRVLLLILIMIFAVAASTGAAIKVLYDTAFERERLHLIETAHGHARMMEAFAGFQKTYAPDLLGAPDLALVAHLDSAHQHYRGTAETGEFTLARREGESMVFLFKHRLADPTLPRPIPLASRLAEPMRQALSGKSGNLIGLDYRGVKVLAAYEWVDILNVGMVAKIDLTEIRDPFLRATGLVIALSLVLMGGGGLIFVRVTNPMVKRIRESEQRYKRIFEGALVALWEQDFSGVHKSLQGLRAAGVSDLRSYLQENPRSAQHLLGRVRIKDVNPATLQMFGACSKEELKAWFGKAFVPSSQEAFIDQLCAIWNGLDAFRVQVAVPETVDGRKIRVALSMLIPDTTEEFASIPVSILDVTKDVMHQHREAELGLILASTGEGIFGMDSQGRCTFANRSAVRMLALPDEHDLLGVDMHALMHHTRADGAPHPREECPIFQALCRDTVVQLDDEILWRADGTHFPADYRSYPMLRSDSVVGTVVTFVDITAHKEKEAQLLHTQKLDVLGQFTGGIAHDFNNLLTIILGNLHFLEQDIPNGKAQLRELVDDARSAAMDGAELTQRLLAFSRKQSLQPQEVDINGFICEARRFLTRVIGENVELALDPHPVQGWVFVDPHQLQNALLNLAVNARDAMPAGGTLTIETTHECVDETAPHRRLRSGDYVIVRVRDTGVGMSPQTLEHAIEPFYTTKSHGRGTGLGLSTVYGFAEQSGGALTLTSEPHRGTIVSLYLPEIEVTSREAELGTESNAALLGAETILVVEDEPRVRRLAQRSLIELGYRVLQAEHGEAATLILDTEPGVDLLFTDIVMPGKLNGRALARWALERRPGIRVLLTTGFSGEAAARQEVEDAAFALLRKPYSKEQLAIALRAVLDSQRP